MIYEQHLEQMPQRQRRNGTSPPVRDSLQNLSTPFQVTLPRIQRKDWHPSCTQTSPTAQPLLPRKSISISELLIQNEQSPPRTYSALCSPSSLPTTTRSSPRWSNYTASPVHLQSYEPMLRSEHHLDRVPAHFGPCDFDLQHPQAPFQKLSPSNYGKEVRIVSPGQSDAAVFASPKSLVSHHDSARPSLSGRTHEVDIPANLEYHLRLRQQPRDARACGFGERDRRAIDPPPIIELKILDRRTGQPEQDPMAMLALHCTLRNEEGRDETIDETSTLLNPSQSQRLMGSLVASPYQAKDDNNVAGSFFVFSDLSCRSPGKFRLHFKLLRVDPSNMLPGAIHKSVATIVTDVFISHTAKSFPGMRASTPLIRSLRRQGLNVSVKKGSERRTSESKIKRQHDSIDEDAASESDIDGSREDGMVPMAWQCPMRPKEPQRSRKFAKTRKKLAAHT